MNPMHLTESLEGAAPASLRWAMGGPPPPSRHRASRVELLFRALPADSPAVEVDLLERLRQGKMALPIADEVADAALRMADGRGGGPEEVHRLVARDPVLAARVLSSACAVEGLGHAPPVSVREALDRIGPAEAREVLFRVANASRSAPRRFRDEIDASARRSVRCAAAAQAIALKLRVVEDIAHLVGLLHDLGEGRVWRAIAEAPGLRSTEQARQLVARYHEAAGEDLARAWGLPPSIVAACGAHHGDLADASPSQRLAAASGGIVDAAVQGVTEGRLAAVIALGASPKEARELVARFAPGRDRSD